jgi:hypothetical protein
MGCKEALFTLGDRPEERYDIASMADDAGGSTPNLPSRSIWGDRSAAPRLMGYRRARQNA